MKRAPSINVRITKDYGLFDLHDFNRDIKKIQRLRSSMAAHGWIDAYPMHVVRNGDKRLKIKAGHHRFIVAQELGLPVKFVICDDNATIFELERATNPWNLKDYLQGYVRMGSPEHLTIKEYHERTGIGIGSCISMLSGQCASSGNHIEKFKNGDIALGDPTHAGVVADIVLHMKKCGISFASTNLLIQAISKTVMVDGFDISIFKHKIGTFPSMITKKQNQAQYLMMIEEIYNYKSNKTRLPVAFLAEASAKARKESFGRISALNKRKLKKSKPPKQRSLIGQ